MNKMNKIDLAITASNSCGGRCLLEMQKTLDAQVVAEFLETVRDFYNDDETSSKIKNIIISETNEIVELIKKKTSDLCSFIDEVFLHRRQRQSSFYKLCHTLARKATPEGSDLPDESKCICFNEENLRAYNVDSTADSKMKLIFNLDAVKEAVEQISGKLLCTQCKRSSTFGSAECSMNPDCNCTVPTFSSQHKIHETILDICVNKDPKMGRDSWYLTHLKRDADYYKQKASSVSLSSDDSVDSFEVISPGEIHLENDIGTDPSDLKSARAALQIDSEVSDSLSVSTDDVCSQVSSTTDDEYQGYGKIFGYYVGEDAESFVEDVKNESMPSDIVKQSFSNYLNNNNLSKFIKSPNNSKAEVCSVSFGLEKRNATVKYPLKKYLSGEASIDHPLKSYPSDALRNAFSSYLNKGDINKWLLK